MKTSLSGARAAAIAVLFSLGFAAPGQAATQPQASWVTAWATALQPIPQLQAPPPLYRAPDVSGRTVRQIVYPTLAGRVVKIHVSNEYGHMPLVIRSMQIAPSAAGAAATLGEGARVTFNGRAGVSVPPGADIDSDPVQIDLRRGAPYAISFHLALGQRMVAWHRVASQLAYVSRPGDHAAETSADAFPQRFTQYAFVTALTAEAPQAATIAAIGDSITDGMRSSLNQNRRWPDALSRRLAREQRPDLAVIDLGISGNRLLNDSACYGDALERRFEHDALSHPGVKTVVLLIGINDINFQATPQRAGLDCDAPHARVTADDLIAGYKLVIALAHARHMRIVGGTLTPASLPPEREAIRQAVNKWIRTSHAFDDVADFDAALRNSADPVRLRHDYDSGDHIHPSDAGYAAMADAVPLAAMSGR